MMKIYKILTFLFICILITYNFNISFADEARTLNTTIENDLEELNSYVYDQIINEYYYLLQRAKRKVKNAQDAISASQAKIDTVDYSILEMEMVDYFERMSKNSLLNQLQYIGKSYLHNYSNIVNTAANISKSPVAPLLSYISESIINDSPSIRSFRLESRGERIYSMNYYENQNNMSFNSWSKGIYKSQGMGDLTADLWSEMNSPTYNPRSYRLDPYPNGQINIYRYAFDSAKRPKNYRKILTRNIKNKFLKSAINWAGKKGIDRIGNDNKANMDRYISYLESFQKGKTITKLDIERASYDSRGTYISRTKVIREENIRWNGSDFKYDQNQGKEISSISKNRNDYFNSNVSNSNYNYDTLNSNHSPKMPEQISFKEATGYHSEQVEIKQPRIESITACGSGSNPCYSDVKYSPINSYKPDPVQIKSYQPPSYQQRTQSVSRNNMTQYSQYKKPGGISTKEIGDAYVDRGNWPVKTSFGLLYGDSN